MNLCADCGSEMTLKKGKFGKFYSCNRWPECRGGQSAHPSGKPMGRAGDAETRAARTKAHTAFDTLWQSGVMTRAQAYIWMQRELKIPRSDAHISLFTKRDCELLIAKIKLAKKHGLFRRRREGNPMKSNAD